ncbi:MAG: hypothetical protein EBW57_01505 [Candidatus Fonsibacter ubiquis]|nr:hypothetical protein [Candidatus Fonsibacter ubiquis]
MGSSGEIVMGKNHPVREHWWTKDVLYEYIIRECLYRHKPYCTANQLVFMLRDQLSREDIEVWFELLETCNYGWVERFHPINSDKVVHRFYPQKIVEVPKCRNRFLKNG